MQEGRSITLDFSPGEVQLLQTALRMLEDTLGREEADELRDVQALIEKIRLANA